MSRPVPSATVAELASGAGRRGAVHQLPTTPETCYRGYVDFGVTQVVDGTVGYHGIIATALFS